MTSSSNGCVSSIGNATERRRKLSKILSCGDINLFLAYVLRYSNVNDNYMFLYGLFFLKN